MTSAGIIIEDDAYELLAFLLASAELTAVEPGYYGTFRLLDGALRLMEAMLRSSRGAQDAWLAGFHKRLDTETASASPSLWSTERERYLAVLRSASPEAASEMKRRADRP